jgi:AcrR family transcriptional regulator
MAEGKQAGSTERPQQLPRGRHRLTRAQVESSQRSRMLEAMALAVAENGYVSTSVRDVITRAGVSRETFYEQFSDKEDCFVQLLDTSAQRLLQAMEASAANNSGDPSKRYERVLSAYLDTLAAGPAYARTFLVEAFAAGPRALERRFATQQRFVDLMIQLLEVKRADERFLCEMIVGSISSLVTSRVATGRYDEIQALRAPIMRLIRNGFPAIGANSKA